MTPTSKLILASALIAAPLPAYAQSVPAQPPSGWDRGNGCAKDVTTEGRRMSNLQAYRFCRAFERAALCRQEIIGRDEGLIATAPTNEEVDAGISETNPTPMCNRRNTP